MRAARLCWPVTRVVLAIVLWLLGSALSWCLSNFANDTATYGSLHAAIGF